MARFSHRRCGFRALSITLYGFLVGVALSTGPLVADEPALAPAPAPWRHPDLANVLVSVGGQSRPLDEALREAVADERLLQYRRMREAVGGTADGQLDLALWCRKQGLEEEQRLHWWTLLAMAPDHPEAIRALRLQEHQGMLLTSEEIDRVKQKQKDAKQAAKQWLPRLRKLKQQIEHGDDAARAAALRQLVAINDPRALPWIEEVFLTAESDLATAVVEMVAQIKADEAAPVLARMAVDSDDEYVRGQAAAALESRPQHSYVPALLARLGTPIELSVNTSVEAGRPILESYTAYSYTGTMLPAFFHRHRLSGRYTSADVAAWGPGVERSSGVAVTGYEPQRIQYNYVLTRESADPDNPLEYSGTIEGSSNPRKNARQVASIEELEEEIRRANETTVALNKRVDAALRKATHVTLRERGLQRAEEQAEVDPRAWWDWWKTETRSSHYFAQGIEVWTQTGLRPIEQILIGDRVLSADPATGALTFNLVVAVNQQAEAEMQSIEVDGRTIVATPEQPFFVVDVGWRKAAELQAGMPLYGFAGPQNVESVEPTEAAARYSLLVADRANYFVDQRGILVHDASRP